MITKANSKLCSLHSVQQTNKDPLQLNAKDTLQQDRHNIQVTGPPRSQLRQKLDGLFNIPYTHLAL